MFDYILSIQYCRSPRLLMSKRISITIILFYSAVIHHYHYTIVNCYSWCCLKTCSYKFGNKLLWLANSTADGRSTQIARFMWPTWGPPGSCRPQVGPILPPWALPSGSYRASESDRSLQGAGDVYALLQNTEGKAPVWRQAALGYRQLLNTHKSSRWNRFVCVISMISSKHKCCTETDVDSYGTILPRSCFGICTCETSLANSYLSLLECQTLISLYKARHGKITANRTRLCDNTVLQKPACQMYHVMQRFNIDLMPQQNAPILIVKNQDRSMSVLTFEKGDQEYVFADR